LATIVEVPRPFRDNEQNTILLCLWHSSRGPTAEQLLRRVVNDLSSLLTTGLYINIDGVGKRSSTEEKCLFFHKFGRKFSPFTFVLIVKFLST